MNAAAFLALAAAVCFATALILTQYGLRTMPSWRSPLYSICGSAIMAWGLAILFVDPTTFQPKAALIFAGVGVVFPVVVSILAVRSNERLGPAVAGAVGNVTPLFAVLGHGVSWRDLILIAGGLFLIYKATSEIHDQVTPDEEHEAVDRVVKATMAGAIGQILILDLVFSLDSIITAVGMTDDIPIMVVAVLIAVSLMMVAADPLSRFIGNNPTIVMLALGFLLMIGTTLIAEGSGFEVPKGYIYAAMAFSALVEGLNMLARRSRRRRLLRKRPR